MSNEFWKFHDVDGKPMFINSNWNIEAIVPCQTAEKTHLLFWGDRGYEVKETPEEVMAIIRSEDVDKLIEVILKAREECSISEGGCKACDFFLHDCWMEEAVELLPELEEKI